MTEPLSHYDALAVDLDGNATNGVTDPSPAGVTVCITQTWLNLSHHAAWSPQSAYPYPVVATVSVGEITFLDMTIVAAHKEGDLYFAVWSGPPFTGMVGVAAHGFLDRSQPYRGITDDHVDRLRRFLKKWGKASRVPTEVARVSLRDALRYNQGDEFVARRGGPPLLPTPPGQAQMPVALAFVASNGRPPSS